MATRLFSAAVSYLVTAMEKWGQGLEMCRGRIVDIRPAGPTAERGHLAAHDATRLGRDR